MFGRKTKGHVTFGKKIAKAGVFALKNAVRGAVGVSAPGAAAGVIAPKTAMGIRAGLFGLEKVLGV